VVGEIGGRGRDRVGLDEYSLGQVRIRVRFSWGQSGKGKTVGVKMVRAGVSWPASCS
jgi:hypothetical protein